MGVMDGGGDPQVLRGRGTRFRFDNGVETDDGVPSSGGGAIWIAAIDSHINMPINFPQFRFRFCMTNESGSEANRTVTLSKSYNGGTYLGINPINSPYIRVVETMHFAEHDDSTDYGSAEDLYAAEWAAAINGYLVENSRETGAANFPVDLRRLEAEFSIKLLLGGGLNVGDTLDLRGYSAGSPFVQGYDFTPRITITPAEAQPIHSFIQQNRAVYGHNLRR